MSSQFAYESRKFSRIYVEEQVFEAINTRKVLERYPYSQVVKIGHYKDIFNRTLQDWQTQKKSQSLILAKRTENFLYDGSEFAPHFGHERFYYNTLVLNCIYNCSYCYLQGMFPSSNIVMFTNTTDFLVAAEKEVEKGPYYLCISYDTDLLLFEHILPLCSEWVSFAHRHPDVTIELRTKSAAINQIGSLSPPPNMILAWTISPQEVIDDHENGTPSLKARVAAMKKAIEMGWNVRLCIDPILAVDSWEEKYTACLDYVFSVIDGCLFSDAALGVFRINSQYLKKMKATKRKDHIIYYPYNVAHNVATYSPEMKERLIKLVYGSICQRIDKSKVIVW